MTSATEEHAKHEFALLAQEDSTALLLQFKEEILGLVAAIGNSEQSCGSIGFTVGAIVHAIKELAAQRNITGLTNNDDEWLYVTTDGSENVYQNKRNSAVFRRGTAHTAMYFLDAFSVVGANGTSAAFDGTVLLKDGTILSVYKLHPKKLPFYPKTFSISVRSGVTRVVNGVECYVATDSGEETAKQLLEYYTRDLSDSLGTTHR